MAWQSSPQGLAASVQCGPSVPKWIVGHHDKWRVHARQLRLCSAIVSRLKMAMRRRDCHKFPGRYKGKLEMENNFPKKGPAAYSSPRQNCALCRETSTID